MNIARPFYIFGVLYHQGDQAWQAQVLAETQEQALEVLWQGLLKGQGPLFHDATQDLATVETVEDLGLAQALVPYPEALPAYPKVLVLMRLEEM